MTIACGCDGSDYYCNVMKEDFTSTGTIICYECGALVTPGDTYMRVRTWKELGVDDVCDLNMWWAEGYEADHGFTEVCYDCGGMIETILSLGYCYTEGELRQDVETLSEL